MKKLVAVLFGLLVVAAGFAAATVWEVTRVDDYSRGESGWAYAFVDVKYDVQHPYTNYEITVKDGSGGLTPEAEEVAKYSMGVPYAFVKKTRYSDGITVETRVFVTGGIVVDHVVASAGWPAS